MPKIVLSFDLEEFDIPMEHGQAVDEPTQFRVSAEGMEDILLLLDKYQIKATVFVTAHYARNHQELLRRIAQKQEIGSHGLYHATFQNEDLFSSKQIIEEIINKPVKGFRMARLMPVDTKVIKEAGYIYDSSLNPTFIPGRYNNLHYPRTIFIDNELIVIPTSVTPYLRIPLFWLAFKNFPLWLYQYWCKQLLNKDGYLSLYFHPWEFADISSYKLPAYIKGQNGKQLLNRLEQFILWGKQNGEFVAYEDLLNKP